jgi:hypothetical protein
MQWFSIHRAMWLTTALNLQKPLINDKFGLGEQTILTLKIALVINEHTALASMLHLLEVSSFFKI